MNQVTLVQAAEQLQSGAVGVLPTDTVYGVVAAATNPDAVQKLYALKSREKKPGTLIAANVEQLISLGIKQRYIKAVSQYWPGAVTVVLPTDNPTLQYLDQGVGTIAVRVAADERINALLQSVGPLMTSSANTPGADPANNVQEAIDYFGDKVDFYVDGGDMSGRQPSTIIRIMDDAVEVLRPGAVTIE